MKLSTFSRAIAGLCLGLVLFAATFSPSDLGIAQAQVYDSSRAGDPVYPTRGQYQGTGSADSANAGNIGELIAPAPATGVSLAVAGTTYNITSTSLTAGEWDVSCSVQFSPAATTTLTFTRIGVSTTSAVINTTIGNYAELDYPSGTVLGAQFPTYSTPTVGFKFSTTTTVYCPAVATFGTSTINAGAAIRARRVR